MPNLATAGTVIFLGVFVDQVSGQRKKKKQVLAAAPASPRRSQPWSILAVAQCSKPVCALTGFRQ